jgi:hypothetical protein
MIRIEDVISNVQVYGLEESIRRAKYPKSTDINTLNTELTKGIQGLAQCVPGTGHDQWLTGVIVQFDLTFTNKAWVEAERYHFFDFVSSQSTMHRIAAFDLSKQYIEYVDPRMIEIMRELADEYNRLAELGQTDAILHGDARTKAAWVETLRVAYLKLLYSNPCGFRLTAGMTTNYRQLKTIYLQRKSHRLPEWIAFCEWVKTLPMSHLITGEDDE